EDRGPLEREPRLRDRPTHLGNDGDRFEEPRRTAQERSVEPPRAKPLAARSDLQLSLVEPDGAGPGSRAVDEHAVRKRHPAEPDLLFSHRSERSRAASR